MHSSRVYCPPQQLDIAHTLLCGQAFRWQSEPDGWWSCVLTTTSSTGERCFQDIRLRREKDEIVIQSDRMQSPETLLYDYFRLAIDLEKLAAEFAEFDPAISASLARFPGLRVLRQDPVECLFSFICTSAAPLYRIRRNVLGLCRVYGDVIPRKEDGAEPSYAFPTVTQLAAASVPEMMKIGLGYRARYIQSAAQEIAARGGEEWLIALRSRPYAQAKRELTALTGIGEKIADCVCLFALDKDEAIPVDTHIRKIAQTLYLHGSASRSLTRTGYAEIGDLLRTRFGPFAGWAQQYLFYDDLYRKGAWDLYEEQCKRGEREEDAAASG